MVTGSTLQRLSAQDRATIDEVQCLAYPLLEGQLSGYELARERHPGQTVAVGFGTYEGSVTAAEGWGDPPRFMSVPVARSSSYDNLFHYTDRQRFLLLLQPLREAGTAHGLDDWRGQRAIGVVYHPEFERGNYVPTRLLERYDAYVHIDRTRAVRPLAIEKTWTPPASEETYPSGY